MSPETRRPLANVHTTSTGKRHWQPIPGFFTITVPGWGTIYVAWTSTAEPRWESALELTDPQVTSTQFIHNSVEGYGGAIYAWISGRTTKSFTITATTTTTQFINNSAGVETSRVDTTYIRWRCFVRKKCGNKLQHLKQLLRPAPQRNVR